MKKVATSVSPFIVLTFPVLIFIALSFAIGKENATKSTKLPVYNLEVQTKAVINNYPKSFIRLLLK